MLSISGLMRNFANKQCQSVEKLELLHLVYNWTAWKCEITQFPKAFCPNALKSARFFFFPFLSEKMYISNTCVIYYTLWCCLSFLSGNLIILPKYLFGSIYNINIILFPMRNHHVRNFNDISHSGLPCSPISNLSSFPLFLMLQTGNKLRTSLFL